MPLFDLFANINPLHFLYLLYGASFLFLGVSIATRDMQGSELRIADRLWLLAVFGFSHGAHEWLRLGIWIEENNLSIQQILVARTADSVLLILSFIFLLQFGLSLIRILGYRQIRWAWGLPVVLYALWMIYLLQESFHLDLPFLQEANTGARYTFGITGGLLTACGILAYARDKTDQSEAVSQRFYYAGIAFIFFGVLEGLLISGYRVPFFLVPVELLRTIAAVSITYFVAKALNTFDIETRDKIRQQARLLVQAEKLSSLGQLAAGIAHEINNPLANASLGIQTLKQKLQRRSTDDDIMARLTAVEKNIDRASLIAQEMLQFSRKARETYVPLDINNVLASSLTLLQYKMKNISLVQDLAPLANIVGDPVKLEQVFINILSNSIEAMSKGGKLSIASRLYNGMVEVRITDTGSGVAEENQPRVFEPFFTTKDIGLGTGMGLFVSYGIIRQHRGTVELSSTPGRGTTVTVKIPTREGL